MWTRFSGLQLFDEKSGAARASKSATHIGIGINSENQQIAEELTNQLL